MLIDILHDVVDENVIPRHLRENPRRDPRRIGHPQQRDHRQVLLQRHTLHGHRFHSRCLRHNHCSPRVGHRAAHMNGYMVFLAEFNRPRVHDPRTRRGHLQHDVKADLVHLSRLRHHARIGRVDAVHIRVDLAEFRAEQRGQRHRRRVRGPAPERKNLSARINPLKSSDDHDLVVRQLPVDTFTINALNPRPRVYAVRNQPQLPGRQADRMMPRRINRHGHECNRHLLSGGQQHVQFALRRISAHRLGQCDKFVGGVTHG